MAQLRSKTVPSHYPIIFFHVLRIFQLFSSLIVGTILSYFIWNLRHDHWRIPWTFILLLSVSLATIVALTVTTIIRSCYGLNARLNAIINSFLAIAWTVSNALLGWWNRGTLLHVCTKDRWGESAGLAICRTYKALFAFTLVGFLSVVSALVLDIHVLRRTNRRGKYGLMQDHKRESVGFHLSSGQLLDGLRSKTYSDRSMPNPGYEVPEEHLRYDTEYHGAHGPKGPD